MVVYAAIFDLSNMSEKLVGNFLGRVLPNVNNVIVSHVISPIHAVDTGHRRNCFARESYRLYP